MASAVPLKLAVLISGSGTTLVNLIEQINTRQLNVVIELVIASRANLKGSDLARDAHLRTRIIDPREIRDALIFSQMIFQAIDEANVDLVCLAGWLHLLQIPAEFEGRVLNIHPSLLPQFGGKGMYGLIVHQAVINAGCATSGCTVHFVDNTYDSGPIILQRTCPVLPGDTAATLAARVFEEEKIAYPEAIRMIQQRGQ